MHPGHAELPEVPLGANDPQWLPVVGSSGLDLVDITHDKGIHRKPAELSILRAHGIRLLVVTLKRDLTMWEKLAFLVRRWDRLEREISRRGSGPWVVSITEGRFTDVTPSR